MRFLKEFWIGLFAFWQAFLFVRKHRMMWLVAIPAVLMLWIYHLGFVIKTHVFTSEVHNMNEIVWYIIQLFIEISIAVLLMNFSKYLVVALLSPLLAFLSLKTERILTGNSYAFDFSQFIKDIIRGMKIVSRNFMWYYFFFTIVLIFSFIFWEKPTESPVFYIVYVIGFYYYGFSFIDYVNERRQLNVKESIAFIRKHRGLAIAIGLVYSMMILVPVNIDALFAWDQFSIRPLSMLGDFFVNLFLWFLASFAPILASVSATIAMNRIVSLKK